MSQGVAEIIANNKQFNKFKSLIFAQHEGRGCEVLVGTTEPSVSCLLRAH